MANKYLSEKYLCLLKGFIAKKFGANLSNVIRNEKCRTASERNKAEAEEFFKEFIKEHNICKEQIPSDSKDPFYVVLSEALAKKTTKEAPLKIKGQLEYMFMQYYEEEHYFKQGKSSDKPTYELDKFLEDEVEEGLVPEDPLPEPNKILEYLKKKY